METILNFLTELRENNNREWFDKNRSRYEESRDKMYFLTGIMIQEIAKFDPEILNVNPKECLFRIFRDVRFSTDKRPYKTNMGSYIAPRGGRKSMRAGYYIHIDPGMSFLAGGIWCPAPEPLRAIRTEIHDNADEFRGIMSNNQFSKYYKAIEGEKLKTAPKGFEKDSKDIDLLRYKSYTFSTPLSDSQLRNGDFVGYTVNAFKALYKMNNFLNTALDKWL